jgi:hypothetical protein
MNKYLIRITIFWLFILVNLFLFQTMVDFGVKNCESGWAGKVNSIVQNKNQADIVCFGASSGEVGVNSPLISQKLERNFFNYCIDGTSFFQYNCLIENFIEKNRSCKLVIMVESPFTFFKPKQIMAAERYLQYINNEYIHRTLRAIQPELIDKCRLVPFYKFISVSHLYYKSSFEGYKKLFFQNGLTDSLMGFRPVYRTWEVDYDDFLKKNPIIPIDIDRQVVRKYNDMILKLSKLNSAVIVVIPPVYVELKNRLKGFEMFKKELQSIADVNNIRLFDFSDCAISYSKDNFYNGGHLNYSGSQGFSQMLSDSIVKNRILH